MDEFTQTIKQVQKGKEVEPKKGIYLADVETARALFTEGRLRIIQTLKSKSPQSIYALAKLLKRDFKNVYEDVSFLAQLGILSIEENLKGRRKKRPSLICDKILFEMAA